MASVSYNFQSNVFIIFLCIPPSLLFFGGTGVWTQARTLLLELHFQSCNEFPHTWWPKAKAIRFCAYNSGGQKSKISFIGPRSWYWLSWLLLGTSEENLCPFAASSGPTISWLGAPSPVSQMYPSNPCFYRLILSLLRTPIALGTAAII
jgi:hypothetical protein